MGVEEHADNRGLCGQSERGEIHGVQRAHGAAAAHGELDGENRDPGCWALDARRNALRGGRSAGGLFAARRHARGTRRGGVSGCAQPRRARGRARRHGAGTHPQPGAGAASAPSAHARLPEPRGRGRAPRPRAGLRRAWRSPASPRRLHARRPQAELRAPAQSNRSVSHNLPCSQGRGTASRRWRGGRCLRAV